jgi:hypothetical protein
MLGHVASCGARCVEEEQAGGLLQEPCFSEGQVIEANNEAIASEVRRERRGRGGTKPGGKITTSKVWLLDAVGRWHV